MDLINEKDAARWLGLSVSTLQAWRYRQTSGRDQGCDYPPFYRLGSAVRYKRAELTAWVDRNIGGAPSDDCK